MVSAISRGEGGRGGGLDQGLKIANECLVKKLDFILQ